ncbi:MAG: hypothetical protein KDK90_18745, partial [Leptospiraceae bacterium]|nr:hypothetical protein [Leptospiraceae bacterium]
MSKKIAIIIPRASKDLTGGAESYSIAMAESLSKNHIVNILTTTAKDSLTWKNYYEVGQEKVHQNLIIKRFLVDMERPDEFWQLNGIIKKNTSL